MGDEAEVVDGIFIVRLVIGDDGGERGLGSRSRRGRNGDERGQRQQDAQDAPHALHRLARTDDARSAHLGAIHDRAATEGDDGIAVVGKIALARRFDVGDGWVGYHLIEDAVCDAICCELAFKFPGETERHDGRIGHDERMMLACAGEHRGRLLKRGERRGLAMRQYGEYGAKRRLIRTAPDLSDDMHRVEHQLLGSGGACACAEAPLQRSRRIVY